MKKRIFKRYKRNKRGGQHYHIKNYSSSKWKIISSPDEPTKWENKPITYSDIYPKSIFTGETKSIKYKPITGKKPDEEIKRQQEYVEERAIHKKERAEAHPDIFSTKGGIAGQKTASQLLHLKKASLGIKPLQGRMFEDD